MLLEAAQVHELVIERRGLRIKADQILKFHDRPIVELHQLRGAIALLQLLKLFLDRQLLDFHCLLLVQLLQLVHLHASKKCVC